MTARIARSRRPFPALLAAMLCVATACGGGGDADAAAAARAFASFQEALRQRDVGACRDLLTVESQAALAEMPWDRVAARPPLEVAGARRTSQNGYAFVVDVQDPEDPGAAGGYVVVREHGRLVVDLVASAGLHAEVVEASACAQDFAPRELTPADHDRIRQYELSQPPTTKPARN